MEKFLSLIYFFCALVSVIILLVLGIVLHDGGHFNHTRMAYVVWGMAIVGFIGLVGMIAKHTGVWRG